MIDGLRPWPVALAMATLLTALTTAIPSSAFAATITFTDLPSWQLAVGGEPNVTVFHVEGPTELDGRLVNDPLIVPSYASQGVSFLPFLGTGVYPYIQRGQGHQIPDPARDGLLANSNSPNPTTDLIGRAIRFDLSIPTNAVGVFTNRWPLDNPLGDGGYLPALDASLGVIGDVERISDTRVSQRVVDTDRGVAATACAFGCQLLDGLGAVVEAVLVNQQQGEQCRGGDTGGQGYQYPKRASV